MSLRALLVTGLIAGCDGSHAVPPPDVAPPDTARGAGVDTGTTSGAAIQTVFVIVMENKNWAKPAPDPVIFGNPSAPFINSLLPIAAHAESYFNPPGAHPSPLDYVWLEGGDSFGLDSDEDPLVTGAIASPDHLTNLLEAAGVSWRAYLEGIAGGDCPLHSGGRYAARHVPFLYFGDVTDGGCVSAVRCSEHLVPYSQLAADLADDAAARYNFIVPDLCDDMHGGSTCPADRILSGDQWLATNIPMLLGSPVYQQGHAAILILWDESIAGDHPIGLVALSPHARPGYASTVPFTHSSTLRTLEEVFGVQPMLGDAANASSLGDLFSEYP